MSVMVYGTDTSGHDDCIILSFDMTIITIIIISSFTSPIDTNGRFSYVIARKYSHSFGCKYSGLLSFTPSTYYTTYVPYVFLR